jgi:hypothetical protein
MGFGGGGEGGSSDLMTELMMKIEIGRLVTRLV